ncbi:MAG: class II aldolase/adducin family protein [candidate division Zixibacteria bacterium]|nr:class II aldolase/adducin family protein [candidate division Zixibacteria bacterium]
MTTSFSPERKIIEIGRKLYQRGMLAGTDGNISMRLEGGHIMITPAGRPKGELAADDLVTVDFDGKHVHGRLAASSEMAMHLYVYRLRPEVMGCVHSHAPYATAFAVSGEPLDADVLPEVVVFVGDIPKAAYAPPGTEAVAASLAPYIDHCNAFLLKNHGLLTLGSSLEQAYHRHETVEHYARIVMLARQLGGVDTLPAEDVQRLSEIRRKLETKGS